MLEELKCAIKKHFLSLMKFAIFKTAGSSKIDLTATVYIPRPLKYKIEKNLYEQKT